MTIKVLEEERLLKGILNTFAAVHRVHMVYAVGKLGREVSK